MTGTVPLYLQSGSHAARDLRLAQTAFLGVPTTGLNRAGGIVPGYGGQLFVQQAGSPSMNVLVSSGAALIPGTASATQGSYVAVNDASLTVAVPTAHASLPRIDSVVYRVKDDLYGDLIGEIGGTPVVVQGTAASVPAAPTIPANSVKLYDIAVAANATTIVNGNLTDRRVWAVGVGGVHPCAVAPSSPYVGMTIYLTTVSQLRMWTGSAWMPLAAGDDTTEVAVSPLGAGWILAPTVGYCTVRRIGKSVFMRFYLERSGANLAANFDSTLFTLDAQYRPPTGFSFAAETNASTATEGMIDVNAAGTVVLNNHDGINTAQACVGSASWFTA